LSRLAGKGLGKGARSSSWGGPQKGKPKKKSMAGKGLGAKARRALSRKAEIEKKVLFKKK